MIPCVNHNPLNHIIKLLKSFNANGLWLTLTSLRSLLSADPWGQDSELIHLRNILPTQFSLRPYRCRRPGEPISSISSIAVLRGSLLQSVSVIDT